MRAPRSVRGAGPGRPAPGAARPGRGGPGRGRGAASPRRARARGLPRGDRSDWRGRCGRADEDEEELGEQLREHRAEVDGERHGLRGPPFREGYVVFQPAWIDPPPPRPFLFLYGSADVAGRVWRRGGVVDTPGGPGVPMAGDSCIFGDRALGARRLICWYGTFSPSRGSPAPRFGRPWPERSVEAAASSHDRGQTAHRELGARTPSTPAAHERCRSFDAVDAARGPRGHCPQTPSRQRPRAQQCVCPTG